MAAKRPPKGSPCFEEAEGLRNDFMARQREAQMSTYRRLVVRDA